MKFLWDFLCSIFCLSSGIAVCVFLSCFWASQNFQLMLGSSALSSVLGIIRENRLLRGTGAWETKKSGCLADYFPTWAYNALRSHLGLLHNARTVYVHGLPLKYAGVLVGMPASPWRGFQTLLLSMLVIDLSEE